MTDEPRRREAKPFEPPPWEREAFDELARQQERDQQEQEPGQEQAAEQCVAEPAAPDVSDEPPVRVEGRTRDLDESSVEMMLLALKDEEPDTSAGIWKVGLAAGAVVGAIGLVLVVWGAVALARTMDVGPVGWVGSLVIGLMGVGFVILGLWLAGRSLRKQGVL